MENFYEKNLSALEKINPELYQDLKQIDSNSRFEVFQGDDEHAINIFDTETNLTLYDNPIDELKDKKKEYEKLREYPFLYFFGLGNGFEIKFLLANIKLERLIVIEPEIELIYILLNLHDFSNVLKSYRLIILPLEQLTFGLSIDIFGNHKSRFYAKVYTLHIMQPFYETYKEDINNTNQLLIKALHHVASVSGNDVTDSIIGVEHHIKNLPLMLKSAKFSELKTKKNTDVAVIVSTGPSLHKQLSLLKKYQNHITIISVDASLPILEKYDIKPDIVTSIERVPLTAKFFENTSDDFQKDIIFLSVSLQHKRVLNAIKGTKVLVMRPFRYNRYFELDKYGYLGSGMSSANLAHELSIAMGYKTCILIGQDLAFAKDGTSHSKEHVFGTRDVDNKKTEAIDVKAYGNDGFVVSTTPWIMFKNYFEQSIEYSREVMSTINATEGGAYIEGSIELPFKVALQENIVKDRDKDKISLVIPKRKEYLKELKSINKKINFLIKEGESVLEIIEKAFIEIFETCKKFEHKTKEEAIDILDTMQTVKLLEEIEKIRSLIDSNEVIQKFYYDILQSNILRDELELAKVKVRYIDNPKDNQLKAIEWILMHRQWLFDLAGILKNTIDTIKRSKKEWDI